MEWAIKTVSNRTIALHQHENVWAESYIEKDQFLCCKCDEPHPNPIIVSLADCDHRPNCKTYWEISNYFRNKELKIRPQPCVHPEEWNEYGHIHNEVHWKPVIIEENIVCPDCLEIAPKEHLDLKVINNFSKGFKTLVKVDNEEKEVTIQFI